MIKFSIITVCLNAGDDLINTVNNALQQDYDSFEIIVKDGFSSDGSIERLPKDSRIKLIQKKDMGIYDAMNQGIEEASGEFCMFINAGDGLYENSSLSCIAEFIDKNPGDFYYGKNHTLSSNIIGFGPDRMTKYFCYRSTICHQAMVISTKYLKKRGYNCNFKVTADRERMIYAYIEEKMRFEKIPFIIVYYKGNGISAADNAAKQVEQENVWIKNTYFSAWERVVFELFNAVTLLRLRIWIGRNPKLKHTYYTIKYKLKGK